MTQRLILLDTGPLGLITNIKANPQAQACQTWFQTVKLRVLLPEISDYELRKRTPSSGKTSLTAPTRPAQNTSPLLPYHHRTYAQSR